MTIDSVLKTESPLLEALTSAQREAVVYDGGPLLIIAGAGTGKTTVIARRIAWLLTTDRVKPEQLLALTFSEKAATEMEERVDLLMPYGYLDLAIGTFHAFGDQLMRDHAAKLGLTPRFRVLSTAEQLVFLRQHVFDLPLKQFRPLNDPTRFLEALAKFFARAKDEAVSPDDCLAYAKCLQQQSKEQPDNGAALAAAQQMRELAESYAAYQELLRQADAVDFGDQVFLAIQLLERHPQVLDAVQRRFRTILVDEFQDTNVAQFRLLQLLTPPAGELTVVADDDQSIYKWRGAAISNVLKFLERYTEVHTVVLTDNFRSTQPILDCAYRLIRFNDPDRLEVRRGIDKRLVARTVHPPEEPHVYVFDAVSSEADWVARTIRQAIDGGARRPNDFAILVRSNREADLFLRALNVAGVPWQFSGASGLFAREESKMLIACLKTLIDPEDSMSWHHVASGPLYCCPMTDLTAVSAHASRTHQSVSSVLRQIEQIPLLAASLSEEGKRRFSELLNDVARLLELSRTRSTGQVLYRWLADREFLMTLSRAERLEDAARLQIVARFFDRLRSVEELVGGRLPELAQHLELFQAMGNEPVDEEDAWVDCVHVMTLHKAKGLEFPVVFMVGLVHGRFPTPQRRDPIEFPDALVNDLLPSGDHHLQEERRLFYVGMTRAKEQLYLTCSYDYGGKTTRKISQFVLEALALATPSPPAKRATAKELIERLEAQEPLPLTAVASRSRTLHLDPHGIDDYLTCPLKYRYSHLLKIPVMRHHLVVYGAALHKAVELFFTRRLEGQEMGQEELWNLFERHWRSEGFLTKEHEELRLAQGREALRRFYADQQRSPERPALIEGKFRFRIGDLVIVGRWDRVDRQGDNVIIIDYKSSEVNDQAAADRRTRESLQLLFYALAWRTIYGQLPRQVELRFLETGVTGRAQFSEEDLEHGRTLLFEVARGIRDQRFQAKPQEFVCRWCAFQSICPFAFQPR